MKIEFRIKKRMKVSERKEFDKLSEIEQSQKEDEFRRKHLNHNAKLILDGGYYDEYCGEWIDPHTAIFFSCGMDEKRSKELIKKAEEDVLRWFPDNEDWD